MYNSTLYLTSRYVGCVINTKPRPFYPREKRGTNCKGVWASSCAGLDGCGKNWPPPGFDCRTAQPVASHNTD